jgi:hypothetical protein
VMVRGDVRHRVPFFIVQSLFHVTNALLELLPRSRSVSVRSRQ